MLKHECREEWCDWNILWHQDFPEGGEAREREVGCETSSISAPQLVTLSSETSQELNTSAVSPARLPFAVCRSVNGSISIVPSTPATFLEYQPETKMHFDIISSHVCVCLMITIISHDIHYSKIIDLKKININNILNTPDTLIWQIW